MQENFDYVSMDNYSADMDELRELSVRATKVLCKERDDAMRMIAAILSEVGSVKIPEHTVHRLHDLPNVIQEYCEADMTIVLRVERN